MVLTMKETIMGKTVSMTGILESTPNTTSMQGCNNKRCSSMLVLRDLLLATVVMTWKRNLKVRGCWSMEERRRWAGWSGWSMQWGRGMARIRGREGLTIA